MVLFRRGSAKFSIFSFKIKLLQIDLVLGFQSCCMLFLLINLCLHEASWKVSDFRTISWWLFFEFLALRDAIRKGSIGRQAEQALAGWELLFGKTFLKIKMREYRI